MELPVQVPEEARELDKELKQITKQKNEAVRSQDFEKVFYIRFTKFDFSFRFVSQLKCCTRPPGRS